VFAVPEDNAAAMRALLGKRDAVAVRAWGSRENVPATVREVAAAADPVTRTFQVKADLGSARVQLGQTLTATVQQAPVPGVARLPLTAVMQQQGQTAVWIVDPASMTVKVQGITVAGADGNEVIVNSGLGAGQLVVTAGVHTLNPGQKVKLYRESTPGAATAAAALPSGLAVPAAPPLGTAASLARPR
jgi:RND family efflux transporter MFP subunit